MTSLQAIKETVEKWEGYLPISEETRNEYRSDFAKILRLAEDLQARLTVAETALEQADDLVGEKVALLSTNRLKRILTAALAEIMVTPPPDRKGGGIPNETGL